MADLKTDYKDDVLDTEVNELRKYQMIQNEDGTVSFVDVTEYAQVGDLFGSDILNQIVAKITTDVIDALADVLTNTEGGVLVGANAVKELKNTLQNAIDAKVTNSFTANRAVYVNANGNLVASGTVTDTELGYLDGVTSNIQTQLNNKLNKGGHAVNKAVVTDGNGNIAPTGITSAEIGTLSGVTSNIQTQLNSKATSASTSQVRFQGINLSASNIAYIYTEDDNVNFRYKASNGVTAYANLRTIPRATVNGTTLNITLG